MVPKYDWILQKFEHSHARRAVFGLGYVCDMGESTEHEDGLAPGEVLQRLEQNIFRCDVLNKESGVHSDFGKVFNVYVIFLLI